MKSGTIFQRSFILPIALIFNFQVQASEAEKNQTASRYYCDEETVRTDFGAFHFGKTEAASKGVEVRVPCASGMVDSRLEPLSDSGEGLFVREEESGAFRLCRLHESEDGTIRSVWESPSPVLVRPIDSVDVRHCRYEGSPIRVQTMKKRIVNLEINPYNFKTLQSEFNLLKFYAVEGDYEAAQTLVDAISNLLYSYNLFEGVDDAAARLCIALLEQYTRDVPLIPGYRISVETEHVMVQTAQFPVNSSNADMFLVNYTSTLENVQLKFPKEILEQSLEQDVSFPKLRIMAYSGDLFSHWKVTPKDETTTTSTTTSTTSTTTTRPYAESPSTITTMRAPLTITNPSISHSNDTNEPQPLGHWRVFTIDVLDARIANLSSGFEYIFRPENMTEDLQEMRWRCVYWDEIEKDWKSDGMSTIITEDNITCTSTHFTSFSVIIDPLPLPFPGSDYAPIQNTVHSNILMIISSIGSAISIIGLSGVIFTYGLFRSLRKERANRILLNLCMALLLMHVISISSTKDLWDGHCFVPSVLLQYFLHCSIFWMLMEAHHMYQLLISVFVQPETHFLLKRCLFAWGIPLAIVGTCAAIRPDVYWTGRNDLCIIAAHLSLPLYYGAYMAPVVLILIINFCIFCRIFRVLYNQTVKQRNAKVRGNKSENLGKAALENIKKTKYVMLSPTQIKGAVTVMILVGSGWIVGLVAVGPFEVFFKYLFTVLNAGQGALIFLFRVVLHPQACREWRKVLLGMTIDTAEVSTTSSTNVNTTVKKAKQSFSGSPGFISASNSVENSLTPSNPDARDLAKRLASMLQRKSVGQEGQNKF